MSTGTKIEKFFQRDIKIVLYLVANLLGIILIIDFLKEIVYPLTNPIIRFIVGLVILAISFFYLGGKKDD